MSKLKLAKIIPLFIVFIFLIAACGGNTNNDSNSGNGSSQTNSTSGSSSTSSGNNSLNGDSSNSSSDQSSSSGGESSTEPEVEETPIVLQDVELLNVVFLDSGQMMFSVETGQDVTGSEYIGELYIQNGGGPYTYKCQTNIESPTRLFCVGGLISQGATVSFSISQQNISQYSNYSLVPSLINPNLGIYTTGATSPVIDNALKTTFDTLELRLNKYSQNTYDIRTIWDAYNILVYNPFAGLLYPELSQESSTTQEEVNQTLKACAQSMGQSSDFTNQDEVLDFLAQVENAVNDGTATDACLELAELGELYACLISQTFSSLSNPIYPNKSISTSCNLEEDDQSSVTEMQLAQQELETLLKPCAESMGQSGEFDTQQDALDFAAVIEEEINNGTATDACAEIGVTLELYACLINAAFSFSVDPFGGSQSTAAADCYGPEQAQQDLDPDAEATIQIMADSFGDCAEAIGFTESLDSQEALLGFAAAYEAYEESGSVPIECLSVRDSISQLKCILESAFSALSSLSNPFGGGTSTSDQPDCGTVEAGDEPTPDDVTIQELLEIFAPCAAAIGYPGPMETEEDLFAFGVLYEQAKEEGTLPSECDQAAEFADMMTCMITAAFASLGSLGNPFDGGSTSSEITQDCQPEEPDPQEQTGMDLYGQQLIELFGPCAEAMGYSGSLETQDDLFAFAEFYDEAAAAGDLPAGCEQTAQVLKEFTCTLKYGMSQLGNLWGPPSSNNELEECLNEGNEEPAEELPVNLDAIFPHEFLDVLSRCAVGIGLDPVDLSSFSTSDEIMAYLNEFQDSLDAYEGQLPLACQVMTVYMQPFMDAFSCGFSVMSGCTPNQTSLADMDGIDEFTELLEDCASGIGWTGGTSTPAEAGDLLSYVTLSAPWVSKDVMPDSCLALVGISTTVLTNGYFSDLVFSVVSGRVNLISANTQPYSTAIEFVVPERPQTSSGSSGGDDDGGGGSSGGGGGACTPPPAGCGANGGWNTDTCQCVTCPGGFVWKPDLNACQVIN